MSCTVALMEGLLTASEEGAAHWACSWSGPRYGFQITFPLPSALHNMAFEEICWHFSYSHRPLFTTLSTMNDAKGMNPLHFGSDPADISIRINTEIWIW